MNTDMFGDKSPSGCYNMSTLGNPYFVGRAEKLEELEQKLVQNKECQKLAVVGLGGVGKTQLALQFALKLRNKKPAYSIFWVSALSRAAFEQDYFKIAQELNLIHTADPEKIEDVEMRVKRHLSGEHGGQWLFIIDNADDEGVLFGQPERPGIMKFLPESPDGLMLFTTRHQKAAVSLARSDVVELHELSPDEARSFFEKSVLRKEMLAETEVVGELLKELTFLPLAITQAAAYLNETKMSLVQYRRLLNKSETDMLGLLSREFHDETTQRRNAVATTWLVSFNQIRENNPTAASLLSFISFLEPRAIPKPILPSVLPEEEMEYALGTLCAYNFLAQQTDENMYEMHRLVHLATKLWIQKHSLVDEEGEKVHNHLVNIIPEGRYENQPLWTLYLPHVLSLLKAKGGKERDLARGCHLSRRVTSYLYACGRLKDALVSSVAVCEWSSHNEDAEDPDRLGSELELAKIYLHIGQHRKAMPILTRLARMYRKLCEGTHPDYIYIHRELAACHLRNGEDEQAVDILQRLVAILKDRCITNEEELFQCSYALARAYLFRENTTQAAEALQPILEAREYILDEDHPERIRLQLILAQTHRLKGQYPAAIKILKRIVEMEHTTLHENGLEFTVPQFALALTYISAGQPAQAVPILRQVVATHEATSDESYEYLLRAQSLLGKACVMNGQRVEGMRRLQHVCSVREKLQDKTHPRRILSELDLVRAYKTCGRMEEAKSLHSRLATVWKDLNEGEINWIERKLPSSSF
ncbi:uncharacterized protein N7482_006683 [Penicillium canariense]|uniref:NB-ARC domain-containing protein n=1 Tax=Penicillium canariense TaxID=189055 RepID=A0A9W9LJD8_9EURO|nr:uncharacterized protein N7482_006683 [Penicillium canariense]KAJ5159679.1 hypothetical protein N7482_006683 [Penicillium canariense]